jgi:type VI secretion system protein ImpH
MAPASRRDAAPLSQRLFEEPQGFQFFQAVRLLHKLRPGRAPVGRGADPEDEVVRFRSDVSFVFPPGDIRELHRADSDEPDDMLVSFMGVASPGSFGSLPVPYTEEIHRQERQFRNRALRDFFDIFNHRIVSLFYRAWQRARVAVLHDLGQTSGFESVLRAVLGLEGEAFAERLPFDDRGLLSRSGLLARRPAPAVVIEALVESLFEAPARVEQFVAGWYEMDPGDRSHLGSANSRLGVDMNIGERIQLTQPRFRVRVGPMPWAAFESLLPGTPGFRTLSSAVRLAAGVEFDFQLRLVLAAGDVPGTRLGGEGRGSRLGRTSWLKTLEFERDAEDALFEPSLLVEPMAQ